jgi:PadR family transcriptional regulator PadR
MQFSKEILKGALDLVVLETLSRGQSYGYEIIQNIKLKTDGVFDLKEGTIYPLLYRLEDQGLVYSSFKSTTTSKPRRYYKLTDEGRKMLKNQKLQFVSFFKAMKGILSPYARANE